MNPVELVWAAMKRHLDKEIPKTQSELIEGIMRFWGTHLDIDQCNRYIDHIQTKVFKKVVEVAGSNTGY